MMTFLFSGVKLQKMLESSSFLYQKLDLDNRLSAFLHILTSICLFFPIYIVFLHRHFVNDLSQKN